MKKILVLGGTKYLGLEFIKLLNNAHYELFIASRKKIKADNFIYIDRKSQVDLDKLFTENQFDVIIDFINYSSSDSELLLSSIELQVKAPKLILISSTYTYTIPSEIKCDSIYTETDFRPIEHLKPVKDRSNCSYSEGKRNMESYCVQNYRTDKLVILRFPIILGSNDYTRRTHFYHEIIKNNEYINPKNIDKKSSYIFLSEAAFSIINIINKDIFGVFNVSSGCISERELFDLYCDFNRVNVDLLINTSIEPTETPFTSNFDFIINADKYNTIFKIKNDFKDTFFKELNNI